MASVTANIDRNIVVVGDKGCGKTALCREFKAGPVENSAEYENTLTIDNLNVHITFRDPPTNTEEEIQKRVLYYPDTQIVLLCFAINDPDSLKSLKEKWIPEIQHYNYGLPVILIGCKKDLRDEKHGITYDQVQQFLKKNDKSQIVTYMECSTVTNEGVDEVLKDVVNRARHYFPPPCSKPFSRGCVVL